MTDQWCIETLAMNRKGILDSSFPISIYLTIIRLFKLICPDWDICLVIVLYDYYEECIWSLSISLLTNNNSSNDITGFSSSISMQNNLFIVVRVYINSKNNT